MEEKATYSSKPESPFPLPYAKLREEINKLIKEERGTPAGLGGPALFLRSVQVRMLIDIADSLDRIANAMEQKL